MAPPATHPSIPLTDVEHFATELKADATNALAKVRKALLEAFLRETGRRYWTTGQPLVEDALYDLVMEHYYTQYPDSPALAVGALPDNRQTKLPVWMGSLDKIRDDPRRLERWRARHADVQHQISDKLDGVSGLLEATSKGARVMTRGNGTVGQDVSGILPSLKGFVTPPPNTLVRGEFILRKDDFVALKKGKNARNVVAGVLNATKSPDAAVLAVLKFVAYEIVPVAGPSLAPSAQIQQLARWGFLTPAVQSVAVADLTEEKMAATLAARLRDSPYDVDGLVVAVDQPFARETDGNPDHAFAFKTLATHVEMETTVTEVTWEISKDKLLKPTVLFEPVTIAGKTISRATGINAKNINDLRLGPGARILVVLSGDVIPRIMSVPRPAEAGAQMPTTPWVWDKSHIEALADGDGGTDLGVAQLLHFCKTLEMTGFGPSIVARLYEAGFKTPALLIAGAPDGFARAVKGGMAAKLHASMMSTLAKAGCVDIMVASNCFKHGFGEKKIGAILTAYPDLLRNAPTAAQLEDLPGVGETTAKEFLVNLPNFGLFLKGAPALAQQCAAGPSGPTVPSGPSGPSGQAAPAGAAPAGRRPQTPVNLTGMTFVLTGFRSKEVEDYVRACGGAIGTGVTKATTAVLAKDPDAPSGKIADARRLGVQVVALDAVWHDRIFTVASLTSPKAA